MNEITTGERSRYEERAARRQMRRTRRAERLGGSIAGGVFLIGLGMLALTGWWWPGIMLVVGLAGAAELARQGHMDAALSTFALCAAIPLGIALLSAIHIPWLPLGAFVLIALGLLALARASSR
ncbi:hypothetical protein K2Z83_25080 [Oscillochloris sp. ZM17-4]|uniref:hypothetical protein n=1 Tax=Oscillochloris sp. ZM17-4 TaxID=2866714 RepID=UPI001C72F57C|nr:hypothetical protein [Oscillochloris sp. ZM17-4]MBX0330936.1 hypothetical protein [Oscillochloris sp. ZM17-4]